MAAKRHKSGLRERFAANLRAERARRGISQEELAEMVKAHPTYVSRVESAQYNLGIDYIEKFAKALGVDPEILISKPPVRSGGK